MPKKSKFYSIDKKGNNFHHDNKTKIGILSEEVMSYYRNVSASLESGFDDDETLKDEFLNNVYMTLRDEGLQVSQNQTVSRILEVLFSNSKPEHMQGLFCQFCGELTVVVFDRFASHVFQSLIQYLPAMYDKRDQFVPYVIGGKSFHDCVEQLCSFVESHMRDVMTHTYGSHILRSLLEVLGGVKVSEEVVRSRVSRMKSKHPGSSSVNSNKPEKMSNSLTHSFSQTFKELTDKLVRFCNFEDHLSDSNYCPVLQIVLLILHKTNPQEYQKLKETIIEKSGLFLNNTDAAENDVAKRLPDLVQSEVGSYLVELLLSLASEKELPDLYSKMFKERIIYFAVHPVANYVLQKALSCVSQSFMVEQLMADIVPYLEDILAVNHIGLVTKLAEACKRTGAGQGDLVKALLAAFHCNEPEDRQAKFVPLLASLSTYEVFYGDGHEKDTVAESETSNSNLLKTVNIHGSLVLQQLFQFSDTRLVSSSLLAFSATELMGLCCDKFGSHVVDAFFQSRTVFEKNKINFLKKLEGLFVNIACNSYGSRCLENIWKGCAVKQKVHIAEGLSKNQARLEGDQWGRFLVKNFGLASFSHRRKEWMNFQGANVRKQQVLQDILQGTGSKKKRKAKRTFLEAVSPAADSSASEPTENGNPAANDSSKSKQPKIGKAKGETKEKIQSQGSNLEFPLATVDGEEGETTKKKRKRKKEKKRKVRSEDPENTETIDCASKKNRENKQKRSGDLGEMHIAKNSPESKHDLKSSKKKKRKIEENESNDETLVIKKAKKSKNPRSEKKKKLKSLRSKC